MIDAAIVGLGRWGRSLVESVQGKSGSLRFVLPIVFSTTKVRNSPIRAERTKGWLPTIFANCMRTSEARSAAIACSSIIMRKLEGL